MSAAQAEPLTSQGGPTGPPVEELDTDWGLDEVVVGWVVLLLVAWVELDEVAPPAVAFEVGGLPVADELALDADTASNSKSG